VSNFVALMPVIVDRSGLKPIQKCLEASFAIIVANLDIMTATLISVSVRFGPAFAGF